MSRSVDEKNLEQGSQSIRDQFFRRDARPLQEIDPDGGSGESRMMSEYDELYAQFFSYFDRRRFVECAQRENERSQSRSEVLRFAIFQDLDLGDALRFLGLYKVRHSLP